MDAARVERELWAARQGSAASSEGVVTAVDFTAGVATVDVAGVTQVLRWSGPAPHVGARVRVVKAGQQSFCALAAEGSTLGVVQSVASGFAVVLGVDGREYTYPYDFDKTLSAGQTVAMDHGRQLVLFRVSANPDVVAPDVGPTVPVESRRVTKTFKPTASWNWYSAYGRWDSQFVEISTTRSGYYFYGTQIDNTIPDSATIISARIQLSEVWDKFPGTPSLMGVHGYSNRPGSGPLGLSGAVSVTGGGSHSLTLAQANALKDGAAFGVGFAQNTGWRRFDTFVRSGAITITWET